MTEKRDLTAIQFKGGEQSPDDPYKFVMSTETVDRMGDVIEVKGWKLSDFRKNPIALFGHSHDKILGTWSKVHVDGKRLVGTLNMAARGTSQLVDEVRNLLEQRILRAVSVGFTPIEYQSRDPENDPYGFSGIKFMKQALNECSVVAVPANQEAIALAKDMGVSRETRALIFRSVSGASTPPRGSGLMLEGDSSETIRARRAYQRQFPNSEY